MSNSFVKYTDYDGDRLICSICTVNSYITRIEDQDMANGIIIIKVTKEIEVVAS
jgi:hypothetical protein